jgi:hypothetical protein
MSRTVSFCLCVVLTFVALTGARLSNPVPALAASGTLTMETPLHESPDPSAPLRALLPEGTIVVIEGPPVDGFYPVTAGDLYGWLRGETMLLEKDPIEGAADAATEGGGEEAVAAEQTASEEQAPPAETPPAVAETDATWAAADASCSEEVCLGNECVVSFSSGW